MRRDDFEVFVADSADALLQTAYLIVWDLREAEDLVQDTLLKVARRWSKVRRMDHPAAYARRILVNLALDGRPKRSRRRAELGAGCSADRSAPAAVLDTHDDLLAALVVLPARQRAVLVLRYFLDLSEAEVASVLQCSVGTVKSTASRGLARLEQRLRSSDEGRSVAS